MGMGIFTANGVLRENYWHSGQMSGWSIGRQGYLVMSHFGYAFALYARTKEDVTLTWIKHLRLDVRKACKQSLKVLSGDPQELTKQREPVGFPIVKKPVEQIAAMEDSNNEDETNGILCMYCSSIVTKSETTTEIENQGFEVCDACQRSMDEADSQVVTPEQIKKAGMFDRFLFWFFVAFLVLAALSFLSGRGFR